ncbi:MAG: hypothetical protein SGILL_009800, partial [Bacillariaceae sp.]
VQGLEAADLVKSLKLEVDQTAMLPQEAMVGEEQILTTADAPQMEAAGTSPASCTCPVDNMDQLNLAIDSRVKDRSYELGTVTADKFLVWVSDDELGRTTKPVGDGSGPSNGDIENVVRGMSDLPCNCPDTQPLQDSGCSCPTIDADYINELDGLDVCSCPTIDAEYIERLGLDMGGGDCSTCPTQDVVVCGCTDDDLNEYAKTSDLENYALTSDLDDACPCSE